MDGKIGYNPEEIAELIKRVQKTGLWIDEFVCDRIKKVIFDPLHEAWMAPEAMKYNYDLGNYIIVQIEKCDRNFENFLFEVRDIAQRWVNQYKITEIFGAPSVGKHHYDFTGAKDRDANGNIFVDPDKMNEIIRNASNLQMEFQTSLSNYKNNLNTSAAFFGGNMVEAINNYYNNTLKEMLKIFDFLTIGENNLKSQLEYCLKTYFERSTVSEEQKVETVEYADLPKLDL